MRISPSQLRMLTNQQKADETISTSTRHLSSAKKINYAAEDPANLARAMKMKTAIRGVDTAIGNVLDSIRLIRAMDGPLGVIQNMILRIKDLAIRASNEAVLRDDCQDRTKMHMEATALVEEIDRQARTVEYNTKKILSGNRVEWIKPIAGTEQTIATTNVTAPLTPHPGWSDSDHVIYTMQVEDTGDGTGARPSANGADYSSRGYETEIDDSNMVVTTASLTTDPTGILADADNDGYYDAGINDPFTASAALPGPPLTDADADGFPLFIDNDDATPVPADALFVPGAPTSTARTFTPVDNVKNYVFTAASDVGRIAWNSTAAVTVEYSTNGGGIWNPIGAYGAGAQDFNPGLPVTTTNVRFTNAAGTDVSTAVTGVILEDTLAANIGIASTPTSTDPVVIPDNRATYDISTYGALTNRADKVTFTVAAGVNYTARYRNARTGGLTSVAGVGTGAATVYDFAAGNEINEFRITLANYSDVSTDFTLNSLENRRDRDGDGYPDIIERKFDVTESAERQAAVYPFGATHPYTAPFNFDDADSDGVPDYPNFYDPYDGTAAGDPRNPSNFNLGYTWTNGSGNDIIQPTAPGAQYTTSNPLAPGYVAVDPAQVPTKVDTDGDTIPDPFDPFPNDAEFTTWVDEGIAYKGGDTYFVSNRADPNDPAVASKYLYRISGGVISQYSTAGDCSKPAMSNDGTALAWEQGAEIWISYVPPACDATAASVTKKLVDIGSNPAWSPDVSDVVFDDGANIFTVNVASEVITPLNIAGTNPDWSPDGDNIAYVDTATGRLFVYNMASEQSYDTGITGTEPVWSPDGDRMAYVDGTDVKVVNFTIEKSNATIYVGENTGEQYSIDFKLADVRASELGIQDLSLLNQARAMLAMDTADSAFDQITDIRSEIAVTMNSLLHIVDDLNMYKINLEAGRSRIEDADMASEMASLVRGQIMQNTSMAFSAQASKFIEEQSVQHLGSNLGNNSLRAQFNRMTS